MHNIFKVQSDFTLLRKKLEHKYICTKTVSKHLETSELHRNKQKKVAECIQIEKICRGNDSLMEQKKQIVTKYSKIQSETQQRDLFA